MAQKSAAILPISQISGQCETLHPIFQCIIYDLWAMTANICLTGIIVNYHNNLPYVIMLKKIFLYLSSCNLQLQQILLFRICNNTTFMAFPTYYIPVGNGSMCHSTGDTLESAKEQQSASSRNSERFQRGHRIISCLKAHFEFALFKFQSSAPSMIRLSMWVLGTHHWIPDCLMFICSCFASTKPGLFYGENGKAFSCTSHLFEKYEILLWAWWNYMEKSSFHFQSLLNAFNIFSSFIFTFIRSCLHRISVSMARGKKKE